MTDFRELSALVRSRVPLITIETVEEPKAVALLEQLAREQDLSLFAWSAADGLAQLNFRYGSGQVRHRGGFDDFTVREPASKRGPVQIPDTQLFQAALHYIDKQGLPGIYVLLDPHPFLGEAVAVRLLREIALEHPVKDRTLVLVSPSLDIPGELARHSARLKLRLPDLARVREMLKEEAELYARDTGENLRGDKSIAQALVQQVLGLCEGDVRRLLRAAVRDDGAITEEDVARVVSVKRELLGDGGLDVSLPAEGFERLAGMARLKRWLAQRRPVFLGEVNDPGLPPPKGVLLMGVQGAGKSAAAKAMAAAWRVPLARLDLAALYDKFQGETERKLRAALQSAEALAPCVLWIDEIEKAIATDSGEQDGGVSRRLLGSLLTWMAERKSRVFLVATANQVEGLPPELIRKGRFDELFFVDLPTEAVRASIFSLHLAGRNFPLERFDSAALAAAANGFSGAEIEQAIVAARYESLAEGRSLAQADILAELARTRPLSLIMAEKMARLRAWAQERCVGVD